MSFISVDTSVLTRCPLKLAQRSCQYSAFSSFSPRRPANRYYCKSPKNVEYKFNAFTQSKVSRFPFTRWTFLMEDGASSAAHIAALASDSFVDKPTGELNTAGDGIGVKDGKKDEIGEKSSLPVEGERMIKICDKLIDVLMVDKPKTSDWRRLLVFSKEWCNIRPHFFKHCEERAEVEDDPGKKQNLLRLGRKLKEIDGDMQRHDELLGAIREEPSEISEIIAKRRKDFTAEFFEHFLMVAESYYENTEEQDALVKLRTACVAAVRTYDDAIGKSIEAINDAQLKLQDVLNSPSVDVACKKIDSLAEKNQLDSTMTLMLTNAWASAKESNLVKDEVKDMLYQLYKTAVGNFQRLMVNEIRIIKYLLFIEDPEERISLLKDAFTPGEEMEGKDVDYVYTTPERLFTWIRMVVDSYHLSREGTLLREARDLMSPKIIGRLEELQKIIKDEFI